MKVRNQFLLWGVRGFINHDSLNSMCKHLDARLTNKFANHGGPDGI
jgi:hypothetical protein